MKAPAATPDNELSKSVSCQIATRYNAPSGQAWAPLRRLRKKTSLRNCGRAQEHTQTSRALGSKTRASKSRTAPETCLWTSLQRLRKKTSFRSGERVSKSTKAPLTLAPPTQPSGSGIAAEASLRTFLSRLRKKTSFGSCEDAPKPEQVLLTPTSQPHFSRTVDHDDICPPKLLRRTARALDDELCPVSLRCASEALDNEFRPPKLQRTALQQLQEVFKDTCTPAKGTWQSPQLSLSHVANSCTAACGFSLLGAGASFEVLSYLEFQELIACMAVEHSWCNPVGCIGEVLCSDALWRPICIRRWASKATRFHVDTPEREKALRDAHPGSSWKRLFQLAETDAQRRELTPAELNKFSWKAHPRPSTEELMPGVSFGGQCVTFAKDAHQPHSNLVSEMYLVVRLQNWEWLLLGLGRSDSFISTQRRQWDECAASQTPADAFEASLLSEASRGELVPVQAQ